MCKLFILSTLVMYYMCFINKFIFKPKRVHVYDSSVDIHLSQNTFFLM